MNAMLMFRDEGVQWDELRADDARMQEYFQQFVDWAADLHKRGKLVAVDPLTRGGHTVRRRGAGFVVDGPYAEGREAVLGYYIISVANIEEALELAKECPHTIAGGATEVREIGEFPKPY
jgi:hypothetical protein